jgi:hypothetical protein
VIFLAFLGWGSCTLCGGRRGLRGVLFFDCGEIGCCARRGGGGHGRRGECNTPTARGRWERPRRTGDRRLGFPFLGCRKLVQRGQDGFEQFLLGEGFRNLSSVLKVVLKILFSFCLCSRDCVALRSDGVWECEANHRCVLHAF